MDAVEAAPSSTESSFGPTHVVEPQTQHTHTAIMLHGRGSNGPEFAEELFSTLAPGQKNFAQRFPSWRWVFPSSQELWSTAYEERRPAWFEAHSLDDLTARQDLQTEGIRQSVSYLHGIIDQETERLRGKAEKLVLLGLSQGSAIGIWTLLCYEKPGRSRLGAFVGISTWLPFAADIAEVLGQNKIQEGHGSNEFVESMTVTLQHSLTSSNGNTPFLSTPIFLGHGTDDAIIDVELGRQVRDVLTQIGLKVEWKEYLGADLEGHWLKAPEEVDDIAGFLTSAMP